MNSSALPHYNVSNSTPSSVNTEEQAMKQFYSYVDYVHDYVTTELEVTSTLSIVLLVVGVFSNLVAIGVFNSAKFKLMSFPVYLKILCSLNIFMLSVGVFRHHSLMLDASTQIMPKQRRLWCIKLSWFHYEVGHALTTSFLLILFNRIEFQRKLDLFKKQVDALRIPVLRYAVVWLLLVVPVSWYTKTRTINTHLYNRTECSFGLMHPFYPKLKIDWMMSNLPLAENVLMLVLLAVLVLEMMLKYKRNLKKQNTADSRDSSVDVTAATTSTNQNVTRVMSRIGVGLQTMTRPKVASDPSLQESESAEESLEDVSVVSTTISQAMHDQRLREVERANCSFTYMTIFAAIMFMVMYSPLELAQSTIVQHVISVASGRTSEDVQLNFTSVLLMNLMANLFLAVSFVIFCVCSEIYLQEAKQLLFQVHVAHGHSDVALTTTYARLFNAPMRRQTLGNATEGGFLQSTDSTFIVDSMSRHTLPKESHTAGFGSKPKVNQPRHLTKILFEKFNITRDRLMLKEAVYKFDSDSSSEEFRLPSATPSPVGPIAKHSSLHDDTPTDPPIIILKHTKEIK